MLGGAQELAPEAVPALIEALKDEREHVRRVAAWALERIGAPEALEALEEHGDE